MHTRVYYVQCQRAGKGTQRNSGRIDKSKRRRENDMEKNNKKMNQKPDTDK